MLADVILHMPLNTKHMPVLQLYTGVEEDFLILSKVMQPSWEFVGYALTAAPHQSFKLGASSLLVISKSKREASLFFHSLPSAVAMSPTLPPTCCAWCFRQEERFLHNSAGADRCRFNIQLRNQLVDHSLTIGCISLDTGRLLKMFRALAKWGLWRPEGECEFLEQSTIK